MAHFTATGTVYDADTGIEVDSFSHGSPDREDAEAYAECDCEMLCEEFPNYIWDVTVVEDTPERTEDIRRQIESAGVTLPEGWCRTKH
jgi:hypothetical protein